MHHGRSAGVLVELLQARGNWVLLAFVVRSSGHVWGGNTSTLLRRNLLNTGHGKCWPSKGCDPPWWFRAFFFSLHIHRSREDTYVFCGCAKGIFMTWEPTVDCDGKGAVLCCPSESLWLTLCLKNPQEHSMLDYQPFTVWTDRWRFISRLTILKVMLKSVLRVLTSN